MRTKTLLTTVAAALAASVISSQAQAVYSQNIVGYANVATPTAGANYLLSVPFVIGVSNGANEVFGSSLPDDSQIYIWSVASNNYTVYLSESFSSTGWTDPAYNEVAPPVLPVGEGFFLEPSAPVTNTFVGAVAVTVGTSNVISLPTAAANYLVGSPVPYSGSVTNGTSSGGGINLNGLPDDTQLYIWSVANNNYTVYLSESFSSTGWTDSAYNEVVPPSVDVAAGFFLEPSQPATWTVGL